MTNLCSTRVMPPILPAKSPFGNLLPLSYENLVFFRSSANLLNSAFIERQPQPMYKNKKAFFN